MNCFSVPCFDYFILYAVIISDSLTFANIHKMLFIGNSFARKKFITFVLYDTTLDKHVNIQHR